MLICLILVFILWGIEGKNWLECEEDGEEDCYNIA